MKMKKYLLSALVLSAAVLFLRYDREAADAALTALSSCIRQVIPSLFPYMVLSSLILSLDLAAPLCRLIPMRVFGLPACAAPVFITGLLCGFPVGAAGCASLCESGKITKQDAARLCAISSHTGPAFLIGVVGALWGSKRFGILLYTAGIIFAIVSGLVMRAYHPHAAVSELNQPVFPQPKVIPAFCRAVTDAASSCLAVTGFIVFFRVAAVVLSTVLPPLADLSAAVFEFSSGAIRGAQMGGISGACMTGFAVGFSGLSVMAQILKFLSPLDIPFAPVFTAKLIEGGLTAGISALWYLLSPMQPAADVLSSAAMLSAPAMLLPLCILTVLHAAGQFLMPGNKFAHKA